MEHSDIPVFIGKANGAKRHPGFFIGIGNDNQPVATKITSINFARLLTNGGWKVKNLVKKYIP